MIRETIHGHDMWLPDHDPEVLRHSRACVTSVLGGEYSYPRESPEPVRTVVDIGCNLGAFSVWACRTWWLGQIDSVVAFDPHDLALDICVQNTVGLPMHEMRAAVTTNPAPMLSFEETHPSNWGGAHTRGASGVPVPAFHPRDLPPCDALKVDCEGCEIEVFENYRYLSKVQVVLYEHHSRSHGQMIEALLKAMRFKMVRGNPECPDVDTRVWVKS